MKSLVSVNGMNFILNKSIKNFDIDPSSFLLRRIWGKYF